MKLNDIIAEIEKDTQIDYSNLDREVLNIAYLHGKYYKYYMDELKIFKALSIEFDRLKKEKYEYYLGKADDDVYIDNPLDKKILRNEVDLYLDADNVLSDKKWKIEQQKIKVEYLESFIKTLNNRGFHIKSAIDFIKFKNGAI